jgi:hypothetical protein
VQEAPGVGARRGVAHASILSPQPSRLSTALASRHHMS